jgi:two-component system, sensor histidine kinase and response regulator
VTEVLVTDSVIKILLVDDDEDAFVLTQDLLGDVAGSRYAIDWAPSFAQAQEIMARNDYDVYLLDYRLGEYTGLDLLRQLAAQGVDKPAILLTGQGDEGVDLEAMKAGAVDYWSKDQINAVLLERSIRYAIERKRADRMERERNYLRESTRAMEQVLGVVGHELRTPLASLRAMSEYLLTDGAADSAEFSQFLRGINGEVVRMSEMVTHMLESARLDSGMARWRWGRIDLATVCREALEIVRPLVDTSKVELVAGIEPPDLNMMGDEDAVRRLVLNLVTNAHKHTTAGHVGVLGREYEHDGRRWIELQVQDTGTGIRPEIADRLGRAFGLNQGGVEASYAKGAGLGLAICRTIVAAHGGTIGVRSQPNAGATFTVRLRADLPGPMVAEPEIEIEKEPVGDHRAGS